MAGSDADALPPRFRDVRVIGDGAFGTVFAAVDDQLGPVAVKRLKRGSGESLRRFKNEFRTVAALVHRNLIVQHELVAAGDDWLLVMELIDGDDFVTAVTGAADPPARLLEVAGQLVEGLRALHAAGRLHCDVKPSNVLVERTTGRVVLLDLGLVSAVDSSPSLPGRVAGTRGYMSPEQAAGEPLDEASDWYAVGVMLRECLGEQRSGESATLTAAATETEGRPSTRPRSRSGSLGAIGGGPTELESLITELTDADPQKRPRGPEIAARLSPDCPERARANASASRRAEPMPPTFRPSLDTVGRDAELSRLHAALAAAGDGPILARVHGPAGYGKTALITRFAADARAAGAVVLAARSYQHAQVPYKALDELIDELAAALARNSQALADEDRAALAHVFPVLGTPASAPAAIDPAELRRRVARAFPRVLSQVAGDRQLALVLDDLHWGDDDSLPLLVEVLRSRVPVLLVAAHRGDDPGADPRQGGQRLPAALVDAARAVVDIELGPLSAAATAALIRAAAPALSPDGAVAAAAESRGVPLFAAELARDAAQRGEAPDSLDDVVRRRVAALSPPARALLAAVAVAGAPVEEPVATRAAATTTPASASDLHALVAGRLVRSRAGRTTGELAIYHDRIRDRIVEDLDAAERTRIHGRLAAALAAAAEPDAERLAFHLRGAGRARDAVPYLCAAAERAAAALALERAAALYAEVIAIVEPDAPTLGGYHERRGDLLAAAGHPLTSAEAYLAAAAAPQPAGPASAARNELRRKASEQLLRGGHFDRGMAVAEGLISAAGLHLASSPLRALPGLIAGRVALAAALRSALGPGGNLAQIAARTDIAPDDRFAIDVAWTVTSGLALVDPLRAAHLHGQGALRALAHGDPVRVTRSLFSEAIYSGIRGSRSAARTAALLDQARRLAALSADPYIDALADHMSAIAACQEGRVRAGEAGCRRAIASFAAGRVGAWERALVSHFRGFCLTYLGDIDELCRFVVETLADAEARGDLHLATDQRTAHGTLVWLVQDGPQRARREVERAMAAWSRGGYHAQHYYALQSLVHIALWEGDGPRALAIVEQGWPALRRSLMLLVQGMRVDALWLRARARVAAAEHARGTARRRLLDGARSDATWLERSGAAWAIGLASVLRARAADVAGQPAGELWATARARCAAADLRGHKAIDRLWPVPHW